MQVLQDSTRSRKRFQCIFISELTAMKDAISEELDCRSHFGVNIVEHANAPTTFNEFLKSVKRPACSLSNTLAKGMFDGGTREGNRRLPESEHITPRRLTKVTCDSR